MTTSLADAVDYATQNASRRRPDAKKPIKNSGTIAEAVRDDRADLRGRHRRQRPREADIGHRRHDRVDRRRIVELGVQFRGHLRGERGVADRRRRDVVAAACAEE
ncbi:hypothetical protein KPA97_63395 [Burkholderia cenocepacia]|nr:hypothetical protein [Burkholderia cenocepacia]MDR5670666.1 hypothetical protein [Burkholderia cenocepacia]